MLRLVALVLLWGVVACATPIFEIPPTEGSALGPPQPDTSAVPNFMASFQPQSTLVMYTPEPTTFLLIAAVLVPLAAGRQWRGRSRLR